ncbi:hypothetical protein C7H62_1797 [Mesoflavibacter sp. HG96]|uniref:DUF1684 domain-containing protein n=1 Tax=Mesoflavibacter TaxID=444051 RepID=UPI000D0E712C|nr:MULTISPECIES: DUF1684 domain-containing protein [Mesoflavibacter]QIJ89606.1 hypothetical protein C7H62_1797 [Mesoflavibacter sp. HG96]QIJ92334.1 hypothetical protein C7H56_1797 [Mesoflavibacter sp. HG37]
MKNFFSIFCVVLIIFNCKEGKQPILGATDWQKDQNAMFKDASKSPLKDRDRQNFKGLDFFQFDSTFVAKATLKRTPNSKWFKMKRTLNETTDERVYGVLNFQLKGKAYTLNVYQGKELMTKEGFEDYLFLPFLDDTNGDTTYGGGRYIDLRIPEGNTIEIDFNKAYNPYCAYNEKFSCPIVPRENYLDVAVKAGVKVFKK